MPLLVARHGVDLVIANVENAAGGNGITREIAETFRDHGIDVMTSGNHIWDKKEAVAYIAGEPRLLRSRQLSGGRPGTRPLRRHHRHGCPGRRGQRHGRIFMNPLDNPFPVVRQEIAAVACGGCADRLRRFSRRDDVGETGDGVAPRR